MQVLDEAQRRQLRAQPQQPDSDWFEANVGIRGFLAGVECALLSRVPYRRILPSVRRSGTSLVAGWPSHVSRQPG